MPRGSTSHRLRWWRRFFRQVVTGFLKLALVFISLFTLAAFVLWDADFYPVRDRWEVFKLAMFGEWKNENAFSLPDDKIFLCEWEEGEKIGTCVLTLIDSEIEKEISNAS